MVLEDVVKTRMRDIFVTVYQGLPVGGVVIFLLPVCKQY